MYTFVWHGYIFGDVFEKNDRFGEFSATDFVSRTARQLQVKNNPFLFIRGLSWPRCVQALLTSDCLKLTIYWFLTTTFLCLVVAMAFKKPRSSIGLEIRPQSAVTAPFPPSSSYSSGWTGRVWQPSGDCNGLLAVFLKVHKIENFFDSDFGICVISLLVMSKY